MKTALTALGERLHELRARIVAGGTLLRDWDELVDKVLPARIAEARDEGVESEKKRWVTLLTKAKDVAIKDVDYVLATSLRDCRDAGACGATAPEPPPSEPERMTIAKVIEKWRSGCTLSGNWDRVEADLTALVQAQARRDADLCREGDAYCSPCHRCAMRILKSAGLG